jgi:chemotaxis family two-component system sensor kinase Cph1
MENASREPESALPDLSSCEREPLHLLGTVEPNGAMLVVSEPALDVIQVSSNTFSLIGITPEALLGMCLGDLFSPGDVHRLISGSSLDGKRSYVAGLRAGTGVNDFDALVHRNQGLLIIELEPGSPDLSRSGLPDISTSLTDVMTGLDGSLPLTDLCRRVASSVRHITGFDRVMVYRFLDDGSGSVIAEDRREDLIPFLGLRYPTSDIPAQARRLYLINTLRLKADVDAHSAMLIPSLNPVTGAALDMTFCILRAMSPIHVEYLRNMGVAASMSISIVKEGRLWGLIACHHCQARLLPHQTRITCEVLARVFSSHIAAAEETDGRAQAAEFEELRGRIEARLTADRDAGATLSRMAAAILAALGAQGCSFSIRGKLVSFGTTPGLPQVESLLAWLNVQQKDHIFATERLTDLYPGAMEFEGSARGILSIRVALGAADFLVWFRPAVVQEITWAGNPEKPVEETEAGRRISPRRSFEQWKQTFRDNSAPWTAMDRKFASALRPLVAETLLLQMNQEVVRLNVELARSNVELESFSYSVGHDLQEPVRAIRIYSQLLAESAGTLMPVESGELIATIEKAASRMGEFIQGLLSYAQFGGTERRERGPVNIGAALGSVLTNLSEQIRECGAVVTDGGLPVVFSHLEQMEQLLQNLIGNAIKYRRRDVAPRIHVAASIENNFWRFSVRDNGRGIRPEDAETIFAPFTRLHGRETSGNGIGLATCKRIVESHNGLIWVESDGPERGATFWFTLPFSNIEKTKAKTKSAP